MKHVNIYILNTNRSPRQMDGMGMYMLECILEKGPGTRHGFVKQESTSAMQAELITTLNALRRLNEPCELTIWQSGWIQRAFEEEWLQKWNENGWIAVSGKPVNYREEWTELSKILSNNIYEFRIGHHSYSDWMERELKKEMEKNV